MALRAENSLSLSTTAMSHLVGLSVYWHEANTSPTMDWDKWVDRFQVAVMAKFSISISELTREATEQNPRVHALLGDMDEDPANKKVVSVMYLSLGEAARKLFKDKYPHTTLWNLKVRELMQLAADCFQVKRNRTLDQHKFFSRAQQPEETLQQFWHTLNGLAALCDFGEITNTLVLDMFILHMYNKKVQEKLCTEPREPEQALEFAIAFEEGVKRQKSYTLQTTETPKNMKSEPVYAVEKSQNSRECFRCGESNFTPDHIKNCTAVNYRCKFCKIAGHLEKCGNKKFPHRQKEMMKRLNARNSNTRGMQE